MEGLRWRRTRGPGAAGGRTGRRPAAARGAGQRPVAARWASAAVTVSPSVPAPMTATTSPSRMPAPSTACTAQATGSVVTASASLSPSGTAKSWLECATRPVDDHPPPVSAQNPVCSPGRMCPKARRPQLPTRPAAQAGQSGWMPRAAQPEYRLQHDTGAGGQQLPVRADGVGGQAAHHLVTGHEGKARRSPRSSASCARPRWTGRSRRCPTAPGRRGPSPLPAAAARPGRPAGAAPARRRARIRSSTPRVPRRSGGGSARRGACSRASWSVPHLAMIALGDFTSKGPSGRGRCEPPFALAQCSTCQPRRRAIAARRASGLTATGKPTASSMARSLAESA